MATEKIEMIELSDSEGGLEGGRLCVPGEVVYHVYRPSVIEISFFLDSLARSEIYCSILLRVP